MPDEICCLNYDSKDTGFLAMLAAPSYLQVGLAGQTASTVFLERKGSPLSLDSMKSKVSPPPFYGMWS